MKNWSRTRNQRLLSNTAWSVRCPSTILHNSPTLGRYLPLHKLAWKKLSLGSWALTVTSCCYPRDSQRLLSNPTRPSCSPRSVCSNACCRGFHLLLLAGGWPLPSALSALEGLEGVCTGLNGVPPQINVYAEDQNVILFGNKVFADVIS